MHLDRLPGCFFGPSNLVELLLHRAQHQGDDIGFRYLTDGEKSSVEWTYADLDRKARAIAASLQAMDMEGERALLLYPSGLDFVAAFFGCLYAFRTGWLRCKPKGCALRRWSSDHGWRVRGTAAAAGSRKD